MIPEMRKKVLPYLRSGAVTVLTANTPSDRDRPIQATVRVQGITTCMWWICCLVVNGSASPAGCRLRASTSSRRRWFWGGLPHDPAEAS
jgi:hypothetical protein